MSIAQGCFSNVNVNIDMSPHPLIPSLPLQGSSFVGDSGNLPIPTHSCPLVPIWVFGIACHNTDQNALSHTSSAQYVYARMNMTTNLHLPFMNMIIGLANSS